MTGLKGKATHTPGPSSVHDVLVRARAKIANPDDWGKGVRGRLGGGRRPLNTCCAAEAIEDVSTYRDPRKEAYAALSASVGLEGFFITIVEWNDAPERTHAEVLAAFDRAIERAALAKATEGRT